MYEWLENVFLKATEDFGLYSVFYEFWNVSCMFLDNLCSSYSGIFWNAEF